jgi:hypothetical protein
MGFTYYEHTNMYMTVETETIIAYPTRVSIQMIICHFNDASDNIILTDAAADSDFDSADDMIVDLTAAINFDTIIVDWSAKPRHFFGLKTATITANDCAAYIYVA